MDHIKALYAVNVFGTMEMTQAFIPLLVAANKRVPTGAESAQIVLVGSVACVVPTPWYSAYNSSKAAMFQYGNTLRIELEPFGIKVVNVSWYFSLLDDVSADADDLHLPGQLRQGGDSDYQGVQSTGSFGRLYICAYTTRVRNVWMGYLHE